MIGYLVPFLAGTAVRVSGKGRLAQGSFLGMVGGTADGQRNPAVLTDFRPP